MNLTEKIAYIKGLMEGMKLDENKDEVKVMGAMADLLEDLALTVSELEDCCDETTELIDVLDEDLGAVEELVYGDDICECGCHGDEELFEEGELYEVACPTCGEVIALTEELLDEGEISCPSCGENLEFDFTGEFVEDLENEE